MFETNCVTGSRRWGGPSSMLLNSRGRDGCSSSSVLCGVDGSKPGVAVAGEVAVLATVVAVAVVPTGAAGAAAFAAVTSASAGTAAFAATAFATAVASAGFVAVIALAFRCLLFTAAVTGIVAGFLAVRTNNGSSSGVLSDSVSEIA